MAKKRSATYTAKVVAEVMQLLTTYDEIRRTSTPGVADSRLRDLQRSIVGATGAPSVEAARTGIRAFLTAQKEKPGKFKPARKAARVDHIVPKWVTVVSGGLPGLGRRH